MRGGSVAGTLPGVAAEADIPAHAAALRRRLAPVLPPEAFDADPSVERALRTAASGIARDATATSLLDAARECVLERGVGRVTMSELARRAAVSRTTLYRHYPDVDAVLRDLMTRDVGGAIVAATISAGASGRDRRERLVGTTVAAVRALRSDALFRKLVDVDPERLLPYMVARRGETQRLLLDLLEPAIAAGQGEGSVRPGDARAMAALLLLQGQAAAISAGVVLRPEGPSEDGLLATLGEALDAQLRP